MKRKTLATWVETALEAAQEATRYSDRVLALDLADALQAGKASVEDARYVVRQIWNHINEDVSEW